jgi:hypothetical protein
VTSETPNVHRALDVAFDGVALTPEVQDLKEEIRANLLARVEELQAAGMAPDDAARAAIDEIGDLRAAVDEITEGRATRGAAADAGGAPSPAEAWAAHERLVALHRVRPNPAFVVRTVLLAAVLVGAVVALALLVAGVIDLPDGAAVAVAAAGALATGGVVADALRQETSSHYPMPAGRALAWGASAAAGVAALGLGALFAVDTGRAWPLAVGAVLAVAATAGLVTLGVTQTNRTKAWVREVAAVAPDRFSQDPVAAARFGLYSGALWLAALAAVVVVGVTVGWVWAWVPVLAALLVEMVLVARMLFRADAGR